MSLVARYLESEGICTVVIGSARDIVEECGVPRFLFVDFPLGNPCGKPGDGTMQNDLIGEAFDLLKKYTSYKIRLSMIHPQTRIGEFETRTKGTLLTDFVITYSYKSHNITMQLNNIFDQVYLSLIHI